MLLINVYASTTCLPNGIKVSSTSFKCCLPKGMPITVINSNTANTRCTKAVYRPPVTIQMMLNNRERQPPEDGVVITFLPNGNKVKNPILKHCNPKGIPITVKQKTNPITKYPNAAKKPPHTSQIKLPITFMYI